MGKVKIVQVEFLDHADIDGGLSSLLPIAVWGIIVEETEKALTIATWASPSENEFHNYDTLSIVKSAIHKIKHLGTYEYKPTKAF